MRSVRVSLCVALALAGCWIGTPSAPLPAPAPPVARVRPPSGRGTRPLTGAIVVASGPRLYLVSQAPVDVQVTVPAGSPLVPLPQLAARLDVAHVPRPTMLGVVAAPTTGAAEIGRIADALRDGGRCFGPVVAATGNHLAVVGGTECILESPGRDHEEVTLTVLVTRERFWVGLSRVNEFMEIPRDTATKLEEVLAMYKSTAFFVDRTDIEITGDADVTYQELVDVADLAAARGFTTLIFTSRERASAVPSL